MPLCTMSQWGWHSRPAPPGIQNQTLRLIEYNTHGRAVGYHTSSEGQADLYNWLRENPHRLHLGRISLGLLSGKQIEPAHLSDINQELNLWEGTLASRFKLLGVPLVVRTAVHPRIDLLAVSIDAGSMDSDRIVVRVTFPYGSSKMQAADWDQSSRHETTLIAKTGERASFGRKLDHDEYFVTLRWHGDNELKADGAHAFSLIERRSNGNQRLEFVVAFSPLPMNGDLPTAEKTFAASTRHWNRFWSTGGAVEFANSADRRAGELERRVVLSQYLTAIQCAGSQPPQETGLTVNSWYGKFHLEMHWWHAAHFALWDRLPLLEKSLSWYERILPGAQALAKSQGYSGARWPKMVGPEGKDSPSPIGPLLIWQQPHPLFYAELCYQAHRDRATLERYRDIVFQTAEFMYSFAFFDSRERYVLGPPVIPAQENHPPRETWNPTFELAYWSFGLRLAQDWRERMGLKRNSEWDQVIKKLSALPVGEGVYLAHENCPQTFTARNYDHPSMLGAFGILPGDRVDRETMRRTLKRTMKEWKWDQTWGWDYPMTAMTAARLGETKIAIDALLMETEKNRYLLNGHNWQRGDLPCYLPGNGGLLYAVAMMARGWRGGPATRNPGFPSDGSWNVQWEGLRTSVA
jgi:hypothetical protein